MHRVDILCELLIERGRFLIVNHVFVDSILDHDQAEQVVIDDRCLHFVQLFRVFPNAIVLCRQEEVSSHQTAQDGVTQELKTFIVLQEGISLLVLSRERFVSQSLDQPRLAFELVANDAFNVHHVALFKELLVQLD